MTAQVDEHDVDAVSEAVDGLLHDHVSYAEHGDRLLRVTQCRFHVPRDQTLERVSAGRLSHRHHLLEVRILQGRGGARWRARLDHVPHQPGEILTDGSQQTFGLLFVQGAEQEEVVQGVKSDDVRDRVGTQPAYFDGGRAAERVPDDDALVY